MAASVTACDYGLNEFYGDISMRTMIDDHLKMPKEWFPELKDLCHKSGMDFCVTIHGWDGLTWVKETGVDIVKIASMEHTNLPFLEALVNEVEAPILISFGLSELDDLAALGRTLKSTTRGIRNAVRQDPPLTWPNLEGDAV